MPEKKTRQATENLTVRAIPGKYKIGEIRLSLEGDPVLRKQIEGFHSKMESIMRDELAALECCFEVCCVSFCCVRIT